MKIAVVAPKPIVYERRMNVWKIPPAIACCETGSADMTYICSFVSLVCVVRWGKDGGCTYVYDVEFEVCAPDCFVNVVSV